MDLLERLAIFVSANKGDGQALGSETTSTSDTMEIRVSIKRHVEVEDDVDLFDIDTTAEKLCCHKDAVTELLEALINLQSIVEWAIPPKSSD